MPPIRRGRARATAAGKKPVCRVSNTAAGGAGERRRACDCVARAHGPRADPRELIGHEPAATASTPSRPRPQQHRTGRCSSLPARHRQDPDVDPPDRRARRACGRAAAAVLALTFTRRAAAEMRERLESLLGAQAPLVTVTTFHGLGLALLREHAPHLRPATRLSHLRQRGEHQTPCVTSSRRAVDRSQVSRPRSLGSSVAAPPSPSSPRLSQPTGPRCGRRMPSTSTIWCGYRSSCSSATRP